MTKLLTPEGLKKLEEELATRKTETRQKIAEIIKEAKEQGDLSENAEYSEAKRQQSDNERRIMELENEIRTSEVSSFDKKSQTVQMGSKVKVKFSAKGGCASGANGDEQTFSVVGSNEADPMGGKISNESPIGQALMGKRAGEKVRVNTPTGEKEYNIVEVK